MATADLFCFSHLPWSPARQRLLVPFARERRVFFVEAPVFGATRDRLTELQVAANIWRVPPRLCGTPDATAQTRAIGQLLMELCERRNIVNPVQWHLTPTTLALASHLPRSLVVYDAIDDVSRPAQLESPGCRAGDGATLIALDAPAHGWRDARVERLQTLMRDTENSMGASMRRVSQEHTRASSSALRGLASA